MAASAVCSFAFAILTCSLHASASSFLSRAQEGNIKDLTPELEASILQEIEAILGSGKHGVTEDRLAQIMDQLQTTFLSLPKNEQGRLQHVAVRYALHNYFVQRHAWHVRGLASLGDERGGVSPTSILQDKVEEFVQGAFELRLGSRGLDLKDLAVLAATYENLIHKETMQRLEATLVVMGKSQLSAMTLQEVQSVIDTYMMGYILNLNYTLISRHQLPTVETSIKEIYPTWPETRKFLRDVQTQVLGSRHRSHFSRSDVADVLESLFDQYGAWQDKECKDLKTQLSKLEDTSIGVNGSGRVRLSDFYGSALRDGNWQFSESEAYLIQNGALDRHGTDRVIIANYVNSPSNCLASSKFYSVCCINECEDLMDHIEHRFAFPTASPSDIIEFVSDLSSSSVAAGRTLHPILIQRLEEIGRRYDGHVPLHGRLFAQWMHHAYPRECPYPHISGTTRPQTVEDYMAEGQRVPVATKAEMSRVIAGAREPGISSDQTECTQWSHHEELYVGAHQTPLTSAEPSHSGWWQFLRPFANIAVIATTSFALFSRAGGSCMPSKRMLGSKDLHV